MQNDTNRQLLIRTASALFRRKGYDGVGVTDILAVTGLPKGSLYHHFPAGKEQLAVEAVRWAGQKVTNLIDDSFKEAASFALGAAALCRAVTDLSLQGGRVSGCPVLSIAHAGDDKPILRQAGVEVLSGWIARIAGHAGRLGENNPDGTAEDLAISLQGAWALALIRQDISSFDALLFSLKGQR